MAVSHEYFQYFKKRHLFTAAEIYCFENSEIIYEYAPKLLVRNGFPFLKELNKFLEMISECGVINKWLSDNYFRTSKKKVNKVYYRFTMSNVYGLLLIGALDIFFTVIVFIFEKIVHKKTREPNTSRFWKMIEMLIDPDRYFLLGNRQI